MKVAIIGAGVTGLTTAHQLQKQGHQITIFEADKQVGGLAAGFKIPEWDWSLEKYYHHWFASDTHLIQLIKELGWSHKLIYTQPKTVAYYQDQFYPLDSPQSVLQFPGFTTRQSITFGLITAYLKYAANWKQLESDTAANWVKAHYGEDTFHTIWQPMLKGKFGPYHDQANMAWLWARIKARTPKLGTFEGGFQAFLDQFAHHLQGHQVTVKLNTPIKKITPLKNHLKLETPQKSHTFDKVLFTGSPHIFQQLTPKLPKTYARKLLNLKSLAANMLILSLDKPLSPQGYYWYTLPKGDTFPFLALVEHTNFVPANHFNNNHIVYLGDYCTLDDPHYNYSKAQLIKLLQPSLKKINPDFSPSWINHSWHFKTPYAQPVPPVNHSKNIPPITTPIHHLYFASMSHIYPWDRGTNFAIKLGQEASQIMTQD